MKNSSKAVCICILISVIAIFGAFYAWNSKEEVRKEEVIAERINNYNQKKAEAATEAEKKEKRRAEVTADIPGIACWGDNATYGLGGINNSYPSVLARLMEENDYLMPVENLGIYDEDTLTVLGRANAIPFIVKDEAYITGDMENDSINISSLNGEKVEPLLHETNPAVNPVTIDDVQGTLYGAVSGEDINSVDQFFFVPDEEGRPMTIPAGTPIVTQGEAYKDYVSILAIGDNGGWNNDPQTLINQQLAFVNTRGKNKDKYIIIGLLEGNNDTNAAVDKLMSDTFGDRFLNIRTYLCTEAVKDMDLSDEDKAAIEKGEVPPCFRYHNRGLNDNTYGIIGRLVFDKLEELGYIVK